MPGVGFRCFCFLVSDLVFCIPEIQDVSFKLVSGSYGKHRELNQGKETSEKIFRKITEFLKILGT